MRFSSLLALALGAATVVVMPCRLPAQGSASPDTGSTQAVNRLFDAARQHPITMLQQLYETNRVLVLGEVGHDEKPMYAALNALLRKIGHDPRLKYIVVERPSLEAALYEALSVTHVDEADLERILPFSLQRTFCISPTGPQAASMAAYNLTQFLPEIRSINARRPPSNPIRVTTVDGWVLDDGFTREERTSREFAKVIWKRLAPSDKAIVLYHAGHVRKVAPGIPDNWLRKFLRQHPEAASRMAVVMIDWPTVWQPEFTKRQADRYPAQSWGVRLAAFRGLVTDPAPEAFDAVVWWANDIEKVRSTESYLPIICHPSSRASDSTKPAGLDPASRLLWEVLEGPASPLKSRHKQLDRETHAVRDSLRQVLDTTSLIRNWIDHVFDSLRQSRRSGVGP